MGVPVTFILPPTVILLVSEVVPMIRVPAVIAERSVDVTLKVPDDAAIATACEPFGIRETVPELVMVPDKVTLLVVMVTAALLVVIVVLAAVVTLPVPSVVI